MKSVKHQRSDYVLLGTVAALIILGVLILAGISAPLSQQKFGNTTYFLFHQVIFGLIVGIMGALIVFKIPISYLKKWSPTLLLINLFFLVLVFLPIIGITFRGASRWINLGFISFQPSEFLKISFILYLASWLATRFEEGKTKKNIFSNNKLHYETLFPFLIIITFIGLFLILQPDASTLGIIALVAGIMYFSKGSPLWHTALIIFVGMSSLFFLIKTAPYRMNRFLVFLNPEIDPMGKGYQLKQSLIAIGSGGLLGVGLSWSRQKFVFLPESMSDSVFSILSEEMGFVGGFLLVSLFVVFLWRGMKISKMASDKFCALTALGISSWITLQAFINMGAMVGILPLTGIPLPFISYGGSHIVAELIGVGILLNISKTT